MIDMTKKINLNSRYGWMNITRSRLKPAFVYENAMPVGYFDEDGVKWPAGRRAGWHSEVDPQDYHAMHEWCEQNLKHGTWYTGIYYVFIEREQDVAWFMLRWS